MGVAKPKEIMFRFESRLVRRLAEFLSIPNRHFPHLRIGFEFDYRSGRVDVIGVTRNGRLVAFEAKLTRWRDALDQAYRNTSFSHYSYVVLPENQATSALRKRHEFERRGVGLCAIGVGGVSIMVPAMQNRPLQPWLTKSASEFVKSQ